MQKPSGETLTLTPHQCYRAVYLLKRTHEGRVESPTDIVDSWEEPDTDIDRESKDVFSQYEGYIEPSAIAGSNGMSDRLETHRIKQVLGCMLRGNFEVENTAPPVLQRRGERLYVTADRHHRSMVAKSIGLDKMYAVYEVVPSELL